MRRAIALAARRALVAAEPLAGADATRTTATRARVLAPLAFRATQTRDLSARGRGRSRGSRRAVGARPPPPAGGDADDPWERVEDQATGQIYWWNVQTNETTPLGAPKPPPGMSANVPTTTGGHPSHPPAQQQQQQSRGILGGLGSIVAEGMAFGTGSALAHRAIGSVFGGGGYGGGGGATPAPGGGEAPGGGDAPSDAAGSEAGGGWGDDFDDVDDGGGGFFDGFDMSDFDE
jgi:hypothetical protein